MYNDITPTPYRWNINKVEQGHELKNQSVKALQLLTQYKARNKDSSMSIAVVSSGWHGENIKPKCTSCDSDIQNKQWITIADRDIAPMNPDSIALCIKCFEDQFCRPSNCQPGQGQQVQGHQSDTMNRDSVHPERSRSGRMPGTIDGGEAHALRQAQDKPGLDTQKCTSDSGTIPERDDSYLTKPLSLSLRDNLRVRVALAQVLAVTNALDCRQIDGVLNTPMTGFRNLIDLISHSILKNKNLTLNKLLKNADGLKLFSIKDAITTAKYATTDRYNLHQVEGIIPSDLRQYLDTTLDCMEDDPEFHRVVNDFLTKSMNICSAGDNRRVFVVTLIYLLGNENIQRFIVDNQKVLQELSDVECYDMVFKKLMAEFQKQKLPFREIFNLVIFDLNMSGVLELLDCSRSEGSVQSGKSVQFFQSDTPQDESYLSKPLSLGDDLRVRVALVEALAAPCPGSGARRLDGLFNCPMKGFSNTVDFISDRILRGDKFTLKDLKDAAITLDFRLMEDAITDAQKVTPKRYDYESINKKGLLDFSEKHDKFLDCTLNKMLSDKEFSTFVTKFLDAVMSMHNGDYSRRFIVRLIYLLDSESIRKFLGDHSTLLQEKSQCYNPKLEKEYHDIVINKLMPEFQKKRLPFRQILNLVTVDSRMYGVFSKVK